MRIGYLFIASYVTGMKVRNRSVLPVCLPGIPLETQAVSEREPLACPGQVHRAYPPTWVPAFPLILLTLLHLGNPLPALAYSKAF